MLGAEVIALPCASNPNQKETIVHHDSLRR
jgi:hypothetical protein